MGSQGHALHYTINRTEYKLHVLVQVTSHTSIMQQVVHVMSVIDQITTYILIVYTCVLGRTLQYILMYIQIIILYVSMQYTTPTIFLAIYVS